MGVRAGKGKINNMAKWKAIFVPNVFPILMIVQVLAWLLRFQAILIFKVMAGPSNAPPVKINF